MQIKMESWSSLEPLLLELTTNLDYGRKADVAKLAGVSLYYCLTGYQ